MEICTSNMTLAALYIFQIPKQNYFQENIDCLIYGLAQILTSFQTEAF